MATSKEARRNELLRDKYNRAITRLEKTITSSETSRKGKAFARKQIKTLEKAIETTYSKGLYGYGSKHNTAKWDAIQNRQKAANSIVGTSKQVLRGSNAISDWEWQQKANKAYFGYSQKTNEIRNYDAANEYKREYIETFYYATEPIWENLPATQRNKAIKKALGVNTMQEAYDKVMSNPKMRGQAELQAAMRLADGGKFNVENLSPEAQQFYEGQKAGDTSQNAEGSPTWVMELPQYQQDSEGNWTIGEVSGEVEK